MRQQPELGEAITLTEYVKFIATALWKTRAFYELTRVNKPASCPPIITDTHVNRYQIDTNRIVD